MCNCGRVAVLIRCKDCGARCLVPYRCGARTCPICCRRAAAAISDRIAARVAVHDLEMEAERWDGPGAPQKRGWKHVVLTSRALADEDARFEARLLRSCVLAVRKAVSRWWRLTSWGAQKRDAGTRRKRARRDTSYVGAVEIAPAFVYVQAVRGPDGIARALQEVLKYATKGEKDRRTQARHAAAVEVAFRGVKRISIGGALRKVRIEKTDGAGDDARPDDLHATKQLTCACGSVGAWIHEGFVDPKTVAFNGGYGPVTEVVQKYFESLAERSAWVE